MTAATDPVPSPHPAIAAVELDGEVVLYDERDGRVHVLNRTASILWTCLGTDGTVGDLLDDLAAVYGVTLASLRDDVTSALDRFAGMGLVDDGAPWTPLPHHSRPAEPKYLLEPPSH